MLNQEIKKATDKVTTAIADLIRFECEKKSPAYPKTDGNERFTLEVSLAKNLNDLMASLKQEILDSLKN